MSSTSRENQFRAIADRVQQSAPRHLVRSQRRGDEVLEYPGPGAERGQQPDTGKPAPFGLVGRPAEGPLQLRGVGQAHAGAVDQPGAVAMP